MTRVEQLMSRDVRFCEEDDALTEPARIMFERDCGCVPVVAEDGSGRVVGMITDRDIARACYRGGKLLSEVQTKTVMSSPVWSCRESDGLDTAEQLMRERQVRRLPVVDDGGHLRGLISLADLAEASVGGRSSVSGGVSQQEISETLAAICHPHQALTSTSKT
jgi:CBS domain-containing protein